MQVCQGSDDFYHRRYYKNRACIPQFDGGSQHITCLSNGYVELDNCRSSDCAALQCLNVCGGPCESTNATCASMSDSWERNFYERSACVTNVTLPDMPPGASSEFKISGQFDAVGSVSAVAFEAKAGAEGMQGSRAAGMAVVFVLVLLCAV